MKLEDLGYDEFFEEGREASGFPSCAVARVAAEHRGFYRIISPDGECLAEVAGKLAHAALKREDYPAVGDWVAVTGMEPGPAVIHGILPRRTLLRRMNSGRPEPQVIAANIDLAFIVESIDRDFNLNRLERYLAIAWDAGIKTTVILNKIDLISVPERSSFSSRIESRFHTGEVLMVSAASGEGLGGLTNRIPRGKTGCFLGSSGVGKSSLINRLLEAAVIRTEVISAHTGQGQHTTTAREMYFMKNGGIVVDNPGMREVGVAASATVIEDTFEDVAELAGRCAFRDCTHEHEPGCAVREAIETGGLDRKRFANYLKLKQEAEHFEMTALEKRRKDRSFGQYVKRAKKQSRKPRD